MNLPAFCPTCRAIRQPNGTFCHMCGYSYLTKEPFGAEAGPSRAGQSEPRLTVGDGFRFGVGFVTVLVIVGAISTVLSWLALGAMLRSIIGSFGG